MHRSFVNHIIEQDLKDDDDLKVVTRFAPEPNGFLHIGHLKTLVTNRDIASLYRGKFILRYDDSNPVTSKIQYYEQIKGDLGWLAIDYDKTTYASDYFNVLTTDAIQLITQNKAYVCGHSSDEISAMKGTLTTYGIASKYRTRSIAENIRLFKEMMEGRHDANTLTLRAKISMTAGNIHMRDPILYRIKHVVHPRTLRNHYVYPTYDFVHPLSDYYEHVSHSLCTREFVDHKDLYKWVLKNTKSTNSYPKQIEYSRLVIEGIVTSKRTLIAERKDLTDPKLYTIQGLRNRGLPSSSLVHFTRTLGISKQESIISLSDFRHVILKQLHRTIKDKLSLILNPVALQVMDSSNIIYVDKSDIATETDVTRTKVIRQDVVFGFIGSDKSYELINNNTLSICEGKPEFFVQHINNGKRVTVHDYSSDQPIIYNDALIERNNLSAHVHCHAYRIGYLYKRSTDHYNIFLRLKNSI